MEGDYTWVVAARGDIGEIGEMTGDLYLITATDPENGKIAARIVADVLMIEGACTSFHGGYQTNQSN